MRVRGVDSLICEQSRRPAVSVMIAVTDRASSSPKSASLAPGSWNQLGSRTSTASGSSRAHSSRKVARVSKRATPKYGGSANHVSPRWPPRASVARTNAPISSSTPSSMPSWVTARGSLGQNRNPSGTAAAQRAKRSAL